MAVASSRPPPVVIYTCSLVTPMHSEHGAGIYPNLLLAIAILQRVLQHTLRTKKNRV